MTGKTKSLLSMPRSLVRKRGEAGPFAGCRGLVESLATGGGVAYRSTLPRSSIRRAGLPGPSYVTAPCG